MAGRFLVDTNIVIALFAGEPAVLVEVSRQEELYLSSVVTGEMFYGALKSARVADNMRRIDAFIASNVVLPCDRQTARRYAEIKDQLRAQGTMIPENDIWIAASAVQYGLTLVTRDAHFNSVSTLAIARW